MDGSGGNSSELVWLRAAVAQPTGRQAGSERAEEVAQATSLLWMALAILAVLLLGFGLLAWVSRRGRMLSRRKRPTPPITDIWFLNRPSGKGRDRP